MKTWSIEVREKQEELGRKTGKKQSLTNENETVTIEPIIWGGTIPDGEKVIQLESVHSLLIICHKENHYGVLKIILDEDIVQVWDAAATMEKEIEDFWKVHVIHTLKIHVAHKVQDDELNVLTNMEQRIIEDLHDGKHTPFVKGDNSTWIVHGMMSSNTFIQMDSYTCGLIVINQNASELKNIYKTLKPRKLRQDIDADILKKYNHQMS